MDDLISRRAAIDAVCMEWCNIKRQDCKQPFDIEKDGYYWCDGCEIALRILPDLPSAQIAQQWIPVKYRPMTEEEREYWSDVLDCELDDNSMFDCQMPDDGQKILVCSKCGNIWIDTHEDDGGLMSLEENGDWEDIVAWMPLPEPYKEENNEQVQG